MEARVIADGHSQGHSTVYIKEIGTYTVLIPYDHKFLLMRASSLIKSK